MRRCDSYHVEKTLQNCSRTCVGFPQVRREQWSVMESVSTLVTSQNVESKIDADSLGFNVGSSKNKDSQGFVRGGG